MTGPVTSQIRETGSSSGTVDLDRGRGHSAAYLGIPWSAQSSPVRLSAHAPILPVRPTCRTPSVRHDGRRPPDAHDGLANSKAWGLVREIQSFKPAKPSLPPVQPE